MGTGLFFGGLGTLLSSGMKRLPTGSLQPQNKYNYEAIGGTLMLLGSITIGASIVLRIKSYSKLHKARNRYNQLIIENHKYKN